ncbi:MAG: carboxyl transferase domain-containing protein [Lachnospiraceae bacterium]|nr:carboxyl transferase domain-containing protein [Lachnospiraceae bacterium]
MSEEKALTAASRIQGLLDENSFVELGASVTARNTDFNTGAEETPSDGVVTGHGTIDGNLVFVFAQEPSVLGGSIGEMHAKKILRIYEQALAVGAPVIGLLDSTGIRLLESYDAIEALGSVLAKASEASGVIPQIMAVFGNCGGGLSALLSLADFTYMTDDAKVYFNSPSAITGNKDTDTSSYEFRSTKAGGVDGTGSEADVLGAIRTLVPVLPGSNIEEGCVDDCTDDLNRAADIAGAAYENAADVFTEISDNKQFIAVKAAYAPCMACGFIKLDGITVGAFGNNVKKDDDKLDGRLCPMGLKKAADFVKFCDAFDIPLLSLVNVEGFKTTIHAEASLASAAAEFINAYSGASVPKVSVIAKAYTSAALLMGTHSTGADIVYAFTDADMGTLPADQASKIAGISAADYQAKLGGADNAARRGYVDRFVNAADIRKYLIDAFEVLFTKKVDEAYRKHVTK